MFDGGRSYGSMDDRHLAPHTTGVCRIRLGRRRYWKRVGENNIEKKNVEKDEMKFEKIEFG